MFSFEFTHIITKLLRNMCLMQTLIYWYARWDCKLCNTIWFYCAFWVFSNIINVHSCLNCCIFTKLSQIVCLINIHILVCQPAKCYCSYGRFSDLMRVFTCLKYYSFHQTFTDCVLRQKCRTEKLTFVVIYYYVNLAF